MLYASFEQDRRHEAASCFAWFQPGSDGSRVKRYACTTFTPTTVRVKARLDDRASDPDVKV